MTGFELPKKPIREYLFEWWLLSAVVLVLAVGWTVYGAIFYQRVLPFFDSVAYQENFIRIVERTNEVGVWQSFRDAWLEPSNVALFRLWAAAFGRFLPAANEGLYIYLYGAHFIATALVIRAVRGSTNPLSLGIYAGAAWLASRPFGETINGVLDQRMDLASGSFCLAVAALFFDWAAKPSCWRAGLAGLAGALAVLHRPVMAVTIAAIALIFIVRALLRHRGRGRAWWGEVAWMLVPGVIVTLPWLIYHSRDLRFYYLIWNVAVGNAKTLGEAASYNLEMLKWSAGSIYPWLIGVALGWGIVRRKIDWLDLAAVALCLVVPLALLIFSRSVGNYLVCQVALGMPALALGSLRVGTASNPKRARIFAMVASVVLVAIAGRSLYWLGRQVHGINRTPRMEAVRFLHEFDRSVKVPTRIVTGFQTAPLDTSALAALARQESVNFQAGAAYFHPVDFGVSNSEAESMSEDQFQEKVAVILRGIRGRSTLVMLASPDTENLLPAAHYSQVRTQSIRKAIQADKALVLCHTSSPVAGIKFDLYEVRSLDVVQ